MPENRKFPPEGLRPQVPWTLADLQEAMAAGTVLEATADRCDAGHTLHFTLGSIHGQMPRREVLSPWISGSQRDIAVLSRVGKPTCFQVTDIHADEKGAPVALLSRRLVQEQALEYFLEHLVPGSVPVTVDQHLPVMG